MSIGRHFRQHFVAYLALFVALSSIGYGAPTALAAPPPNDNRDNAQVLPTFPAVTEGTTVSDTDPDEKSRQMSISAALTLPPVYCPVSVWKLSSLKRK